MPDTISTDLHKASLNIQQSDMPNVMSKMMLLGMSFPDVLVRSTVNPAKEIGRYPELGTLGVGRAADIAVLEEQTGVFAFKDAWPAKRLGTRRLECVLTVRDGKVVYQRTSGRRPALSDTQIYDILIKHGRLSNEETDVALIGNRVARVGHRLPAAHARLVIEAEGYDVRSVTGDCRSVRRGLRYRAAGGRDRRPRAVRSRRARSGNASWHPGRADCLRQRGAQHPGRQPRGTVFQLQVTRRLRLQCPSCGRGPAHRLQRS